MRKKTSSSTQRFDDPLKEATTLVLKRVIGPLLELMVDAGVTVHEFSQLTRETAVRSAARRVTRENGRISKSRVAIITGLPRSEVARVLMSADTLGKRLGQHPSRKVLAAWFDNPRFLAPNGDPAVLPIFGKRRSFEELVSMQVKGMPIRAMLDELIQINAVEILEGQRVKAISRVPISSGLTATAISVIGERTRDLLETLTKNLHRASKPLFEATAIVDDADPSMVPVIRREIAEQGTNLISSATSLLNRSSVRLTRSNNKPSAKCRLGVTVYYFQDENEGSPKSKIEPAVPRRKNFQRQPYQIVGKVTPALRTRKGSNL